MELQKNEFKLNINQHLSLEVLTKFSRDQLIGKSFEFKNMEIMMNDFILSESQSRMVAQIHTSGSLDGIIDFTCSPKFNHQLQRFDLIDPQISVKTNNLLQKGAIWVFKSKIEEIIRNRIENLQAIKLNQLIKNIKSKYSNINLNPDLNLTFQLNELEIERGQFQDGHICLQIALKGLMNIENN